MGIPKIPQAYQDDPPLSSSASAHSLQPYHDVEPDDSPPAYTDDDNLAIPQPSSIIAAATPLSTTYRLESPYHIPGGRTVTSKRAKKTYTVTLHPEFSQDPEALHGLILVQSNRPPVPVIVVKGTHTVTRKDSSSKSGTSKETVVDFDFSINCVGSVVPDVNQSGVRWRNVQILEEEGNERGWRGGRVKSKMFGKKKKARAVSAEGGDGVEADADLERGRVLTREEVLKEWCERFCEDKAGVRSFTFHRTLQFWDHHALTKGLTTLIRSLNYRGHISITTHTHNSHLTVYTPHLLNKLRTNSIVWWTCVILQLWLITWPILLLLERRYEPITATWYARDENGEYACGLDEAGWLEFFAPVVKRSVLSRAKDGEVVGLEEARGARQEAERVARGEVGVRESEAERERRERLNRGQGGWTDSLVGVVRGVAEVGMEWNQAAGWGGDR
ncbi:hypothetical protein AJ79_02700 [Helicocarpus griseus UAMH5409]|uniref:Uncharacterized protein n=1 Tax=Helicocarpus griseus UAMH5409 TaxID=1447875 RepID=A0A2B7Y2I2_9EURO|nr:hypothetical protein AJ79_02700 [Helicocarpus griseus UAMH5409]